MALICIIGMSCAGKDLIQSELNKRFNIPICVSHTSRPMRSSDIPNKSYYFITKDEFIDKAFDNEFLEMRSYETVEDVWYYGLSKQEVDLSKNQLTILDEKGYFEVRDKIGQDNIIPIYIYVDEITRINRALNREKRTDKQYYMETYRRSLADLQDFSCIENDNCVFKVENIDLEKAILEIRNYLEEKGVII